MIFAIYQLLLQMSILFIGEKSSNNYSSPFFCNNLQELNIAKKEKQLRQDQYRFELLDQMRHKYEQTRKQREEEKRYNRKYERNHTESPQTQPVEEIIHHPISYQRREDVLERASLLKGRREDFRLFQEQRSSFRSSPKANSVENISLNKSKVNKYDERLKTESINDYMSFESIVVDLQKRRKELNLNDSDDRNIDKVYEKMYDSVQALNRNTQDNNNLLIKYMGLDSKRTNGNRYIISRHPVNPEEEVRDSFKLPSITKRSNYETKRQTKTNDSQSNWREWYAKEKLKELQSYYRRMVSSDRVPYGEDSNYPIAMPSFQGDYN